jgi:hypothetical protein
MEQQQKELRIGGKIDSKRLTDLEGEYVMAKNYKYKKATIADIDELVKTRIIVIRAANKLSNDVDMSLVEKESYEYYKRALETGEHINVNTLCRQLKLPAEKLIIPVKA